jgi:hypothetical protein
LDGTSVGEVVASTVGAVEGVLVGASEGGAVHMLRQCPGHLEAKSAKSGSRQLELSVSETASTGKTDAHARLSTVPKQARIAVGDCVGACVGDSVMRAQLATAFPATKRSGPSLPHPVPTNAVGSIDVADAGMVDDVKCVIENAECPMAVSCESVSNVTVVRSAHWVNALSSISVTLAGISIAVIPDPSNALDPMVASCEPASKLTVVRLGHWKNAYASSSVTVAGIAIDVIAVKANPLTAMVASCEPAANETVVRLEQR